MMSINVLQARRPSTSLRNTAMVAAECIGFGAMAISLALVVLLGGCTLGPGADQGASSPTSLTEAAEPAQAGASTGTAATTEAVDAAAEPSGEANGAAAAATPSAAPSGETSATETAATADHAAGERSGERRTLVVASYGSLPISEDVMESFETASGTDVQLLDLGPASEGLTEIPQTLNEPQADVLYGVDLTHLARILDADLLEPYESPLLESVPDDLELDPDHKLLPVTVGYVDINADREWFAREGVAFPQSLEDLTKPEYKGLLVVENPATSSLGLSFLLATVSAYGEEEYLDYWSALRDNDVLIADDWDSAYTEHFTVGSGGSGDRPLIVGWTTGPVAELVGARDSRTDPLSVNISPPGETFRQVTFVGLLKDAPETDLAREFIDFVLDETFQNDIPLRMFVYPVNQNAVLPELFLDFAHVPEDPVQLSPDDIEDHRDGWIEAWSETVLQ